MNHIAAIHVLKNQLQLAESDYRALLLHLTGHNSCKDMQPPQQLQVREHMQKLAVRMGLPQTSHRSPLTAEQFAQVKRKASPKERKVWALWHQLGRDGLVDNTSGQALNAWVQRQVGVSALRFATPAQLDTLIEAAKGWLERKV
ncbi:regulatory protein GemA [Comamonas aquatica]|uniref:regulatory protein GemA n=1 Tax=Comamonas aquatica TaxID=225991 RepID=UPI0034D3F4DD